MRSIVRHGPLLFLVQIGLIGTAAAQEPFSRVGAELGATFNMNRNGFHDYWKSGRGGGVTLTTPFYWGTLEMGATVHRYHAKADVTEFGVVWAYTGVRKGWQLAEAVSVQPGIRLGMYRMSFDDAETSFYGVATESDLTLSSGAVVRYELKEYLLAFVRVDFVRVHTRPLLHYWYLSGGIAFDLEAGRAWRAFWE
ncbi:MAG: hypothetical protein OXU68_13930 [Bacteroidota bacterium]|nr:hypothetical protein [Bacteroidota bacterium]MDE2958088.1 hypothetical protein [Bacteroidota bacterium]